MKKTGKGLPARLSVTERGVMEAMQRLFQGRGDGQQCPECLQELFLFPTLGTQDPFPQMEPKDPSSQRPSCPLKQHASVVLLGTYDRSTLKWLLRGQRTILASGQGL